MNVGIVGLGRMGSGMGARLAERGHAVFGFDVAPDKRAEAESVGIKPVGSLSAFGSALQPPRVVIMMVPAGPIVDQVIAEVAPALTKGDVLVDGGNSFYKDSIERGKRVQQSGIGYLDTGVSGGIWGHDVGFCLMVGGDESAFKTAEPVFKDLAPDKGYAHVGPIGAGHFSKMVHNGIEYGMLQAYGEGFEVLKESPFDYDLKRLADLWNRGSVVRSWLLELAQLAFEESPDLADVRGWVEDSGEGRWTAIEAINESVPTPVITLSLLMRFRSRQDDSFSAKVIAALRNKFGGHSVRKE